MEKKVDVKEWTPFKGVIDSEDGLRNDVLVSNIGGDADDAMRGGAKGGEFEHGIRPKDVPIDGILIGEHTLCESLTDDDDRFTALLAVPLVEITATEDGNAERGKKSGRDDAQLSARVFSWGMHMTVGRELKAEAGIAPGNNHAERGLVHPGQRINAPNCFLVEIDHLQRRFSVGRGGDICREGRRALATGLRVLWRDHGSDPTGLAAARPPDA